MDLRGVDVYHAIMGSVTQSHAKTILIRQKHVDSWFVSRAHLNIYRGCSHNCAYCDGRYEGYHVPDDFGSDIIARVNAPALLDNALNPLGKRTSLHSGYILLGGGVCDSYQPVEQTLGLARACLEVIAQRRQPVHILTKSILVERDLPIIQEINNQSAAVLSVSFSGVNDDISRIFEPGCPPPSARLKMMKTFVAAGIPVGMFLLPVIPGVTDTAERIMQSVAAAHEIGASFILFGGMTLKAGRQQDHFTSVLQHFAPDVLARYPRIYKGDHFGAAVIGYSQKIEQRFINAIRKYPLPRRMPPRLYWEICSEPDRLQIILSQLNYLQQASRQRHPFSRLAKLLANTSGAPTLFDLAQLPPALWQLYKELIAQKGEEWFSRFP